jgi:23S rRNA (cytosine1962-C5)-methyltransferase
MSSDEPRVLLNRRRAQPFFFRHPWVFSGAIQSVWGETEKPPDGAIVGVYSQAGQWIGRGFYNARSQIRVRLFSWRSEEVIDEDFWRARLAMAIDLRERVLRLHERSSAYRLVYSDSDGFPGLIVDRYGDYLVMEWGSLGLFERREVLVRLLVEAVSPAGVLSRVEGDEAAHEGLPRGSEWVHGAPAPSPLPLKMGRVTLLADLSGGQKTGLYLDQRENYAAVADRLVGMRVLDGFSYAGGFGLSAAAAGAREVLGFDTSAPAVNLANRAAELNGLANVRYAVGDVFAELRRLRAANEIFDAVILDPPRFAPSRAALPRAVRGYKDINLVAMQILRPNGLLITSSCSQHVSAEDFLSILNQAATDVGRTAQVVERRGQSADHPVIVSCPETAYLKCFVCVVR